MYQFGMRSLLLAAVIVAPGTLAFGQQWGSLKGRFVLDGTPPAPVKVNVDRDAQAFGNVGLVVEDLVVDAETKGIANIVVYLNQPGAAVHPDYSATAQDPVEMDNKNGRFEPRVVTLRLTQPLILKNSDPVGHNTNMAPLGDRAINPLIPPGGQVEYKFNREQRVPQKVGCNIHPWMGGFVLPRSNPYAVVSAKDGSFEIKNLPAGMMKFKAWHEMPGYLALSDWPLGDFTVAIKPGETTDLGDIKAPVSLFQKK